MTIVLHIYFENEEFSFDIEWDLITLPRVGEKIYIDDFLQEETPFDGCAMAFCVTSIFYCRDNFSNIYPILALKPDEDKNI
jgi:hypothetical protein